MLDTFLATLNPMLTLFICIAVGYIANKTKILPENAGKVMAKLETWIFCPALSFSTINNRRNMYGTVDHRHFIPMSRSQGLQSGSGNKVF